MNSFGESKTIEVFSTLNSRIYSIFRRNGETIREVEENLGINFSDTERLRLKLSERGIPEEDLNKVILAYKTFKSQYDSRQVSGGRER
jgi:hypothetical protein